MSLWTRSLIGGLSEFFTIELKLCEEHKVEVSFQKNRILNRVFGQKTCVLNW